MITFDPVTPAPFAVRLVRAIVPFAMCFAYLAFRAYPAVDGRIPLGEAIVMGLVLMGLAMVGLIALGDLLYPAAPRARRRATSEELEITAVHAPIADAATVIAASYAAELAEFDAWVEDPQPFEPLFTHDYAPQHHTPPGGFAAVTADVDAPTALHVLRGDLYDAADTGRHHKGEA